MNNQKISKILSIIVMFGGIMVMFGWFAGIPILTSILPTWVTMKFTTALSFFLSGLILFFILRHQEGRQETGKIVLPIASLIILLLMATLLVSTFIGIRTGIEDLFVEETGETVKTTTPGRPSSGTMVAFILTAVVGLVTIFNLTPEKLKRHLNWMGIVIGVLGLLAILGYIINVPLLYYTFEVWSTAMAFHTAIFFTMIGIGLFLLGRPDKDFTSKKSAIAPSKKITKNEDRLNEV